MKTTIVTGLLGSGKTTFIRNRLESIAEKTVVLVNDFGSAGIDGEILSADGIMSVELPSGCVCCTLKFDLISTITGILRDHPGLQFRSADHIHFETLSFPLVAGTDPGRFSSFFDDLAAGAFGSVSRAKALINSGGGSLRFDAVYGKVDKAPFGKEVRDGRLVVIGEGLDKKALEQKLPGRVS